MTTKSEITKSKDSTITKEFKPTPHMEKWLATTLQSGSDVIDEISRLSGVDESTYYLWCKQPGYLEWFDLEYQRALKGNRWRLTQIGMKNAKRDHKYWQDMMKVTGNLNEDRGSNVAIQVNQVINDKKEEYGI